MKRSTKHTLIASLVSAAILALAALSYVYFSTQPAQPGNIEQTPILVNSKRVVAVGDVACSPTSGQTPGACQQAATADIAQQFNPDAVLLLGDLQYDTGRLADFNGSYD